MEKICLVKAGKFLLGLETSKIISTFNIDNLKDCEINNTNYIFLFLEAFLAQKHLNISGSKIIVLKSKNKSKPLALLIDKTLGEIELPDQFEPYPLLYPELAKKYCPKIYIHGDQVVLLLDTKQLSMIHGTLQTDHGLITLDDLMPVETELTPTAESKSAAKIDDSTIHTIVSWTFDRYNEFYSDTKAIKFYSNEKAIISVDELPSGLVQQQGLSTELIQLLIDKTILQCEKTRHKTMKMMIKD
ncbi:MAG: hypothetical protein KAJ62_14745, partial [Desulfobacteraceae bacterium]|nr:hypothetical protein [Desulfobacteraceae bacterium]